MELTLDLEEDLHETLKRRAQNNGFESTEEYAQTILRTVVEELESDATNEDVEARLEDLGYLS